MSEEAAAAETEITPNEQQEQPAPAEPMFTQEQVNDLLAKERATATRKANQKAKMAAQSKQEPTTDAGDSRLDAMQEQIQQLVAATQANLEKQTANERTTAFATDTAGLGLSETDAATLRVLQEHSPDLYAAKIAEARAGDQPPAAKGPGLASPGAPAAVPTGPDMNSITSWTADDVKSMKDAGTFRENLRKARGNMPGGSGGLFPARK